MSLRFEPVLLLPKTIIVQSCDETQRHDSGCQSPTSYLLAIKYKDLSVLEIVTYLSVLKNLEIETDLFLKIEVVKEKDGMRRRVVVVVVV